jgi:hypothetical protein
MFLESFFAGFLGGVISLLLSFAFTTVRKKVKASTDNKKRLAQLNRKNKDLLLD